MKKLISLFLTAGIIASVLAQSPRELVTEKAGDTGIMNHPSLQIEVSPATCIGGDGSITVFLHFIPVSQDDAILVDIGEQEEGDDGAYWSLTLIDENDVAIEKAADFNETVSFTGLARGTYSIVLKDKQGYHRIHKKIAVKGSPPVNADFEMNATEVNVEDVIYFRNRSDGATFYEWDFGDGSPAVRSENASHYFKVPGLYEVTLTALNNHCLAQKTAAVTVAGKVTGITAASGENSFHAYADGEGISVVFDFISVEPAQLTIYDVAGRQLASEKVLTEGVKRVTIASADACILVHLGMKGQSYTKKVMFSRD